MLYTRFLCAYNKKSAPELLHSSETLSFKDLLLYILPLSIMDVNPQNVLATSLKRLKPNGLTKPEPF